MQKGFIAGIAPAITTAILVSISIVVLFLSFGTVVPPGSMGVVQILWGPAQGYSEEGRGPGLYLTIPFYRTVHVIPETLRIQDFNRHAHGGEALEIKATDGAVVDVDISVLTRFERSPREDGGLKYGGPAELFKNSGIDEEAWNRTIGLVVSNEMRRALGQLRSGQFYDVTIREAALEAGEQEVKRKLAPLGIYVEGVLLRRYTYRDDRIDEAIFNKNLQDQEQRLKDAASSMAQVKAELEQVSAEWDAKVETLRVQGENEARILNSEAKKIEAEKRASGDLLVAKAQAEVDQKRAGALSQSQAAQLYVARELTPFIGTLRGGVIREVDPYNLPEWLEKLGIKSTGGAQ